MLSISILSSNFLELGKTIESINQSKADYIHIDVMDGCFVPNITIGFDIIKQIKKVSIKPLDVHLMICNPEKYIDKFAECGADVITIHFEGSIHLNKYINEIKKKNVKCGVAINPHTPVNFLVDIISEIDVLLIMSVNPGFGGQQFLENTYKKISEAKLLKESLNNKLIIEVDGGINETNYKKIYFHGADMIVLGNTIFSNNNIIEKINFFKKQD